MSVPEQHTPRFRRNEKLYQIALRSHWTYALKLALVGALIGGLVLPALLSGDPDLHPLARTVRFLAVVFSAGFAGIAAYRYFKPVSGNGEGGDAASAESGPGEGGHRG
ncbi:MAG: hypothetical protein ACK4KV_06700 [Rhodocyclaceae bacterium]